ncbi:hypothetical protein ACET3Z_018768 [Daucus carota]
MCAPFLGFRRRRWEINSPIQFFSLAGPGFNIYLSLTEAGKKISVWGLDRNFATKAAPPKEKKVEDELDERPWAHHCFKCLSLPNYCVIDKEPEPTGAEFKEI